MAQVQNASQDSFKEWYISGLQAVVSATEISKKNLQKLKKYASSSALRDGIEEGEKATKKQADAIKQLLTEAGGEPSGVTNTIMDGINTTADQIAQSDDKDVRDAGVITSVQLALHYYIAAYGGLASTAKHLGMPDQAEQFSKMVDEIKSSDKAFSKLAKESINQRAAA